MQAYVLSHCGCIDGSLPNIYINLEDEIQVCQNLTALDCVSDARSLYFGENSTRNAECRSTQCPSECDTASFEITTSSSRYPTSYYQSYMRAHTNILEKFPSTAPPELTKTTVYLSAFYEEISATYTAEVPAITGTEVLGTIGGNLGLFIGASLLTIVEVIELFIEFLFIALNKRF